MTANRARNIGSAFMIFAFLGVAAAFYFLQQPDPKPQTPVPGNVTAAWVSPRTVCVQFVVHPDMFICPDRHTWQDVGQVSPIPPTPKG